VGARLYIASALYDTAITAGYSCAGNINQQATREGFTSAVGSPLCNNLTDAVTAVAQVLSSGPPAGASGVLNWRGKGFPFMSSWPYVIRIDFTTFYGYVDYLRP
jgi:hypothetical protein